MTLMLSQMIRLRVLILTRMVLATMPMPSRMMRLKALTPILTVLEIIQMHSQRMLTRR